MQESPFLVNKILLMVPVPFLMGRKRKRTSFTIFWKNLKNGARKQSFSLWVVQFT